MMIIASHCPIKAYKQISLYRYCSCSPVNYIGFFSINFDGNSNNVALKLLIKVYIN